MDPAIQQALLLQLSAVVVGGLLSIVGGFLSTIYLERKRARQEARALALAFKGEIGALVSFIRERSYRQRIGQIIEQIKATGTPFFMAFNVRYSYDRVYSENVDKVGLLDGRLPEYVPRFYTLLNSLLEDLLNMGDQTYAESDLPTVLRIYNDLARFMDETVSLGDQIVAEVNRLYS